MIVIGHRRRQYQNARKQKILSMFLSFIFSTKLVHTDFAYRKNIQIPVAISNTNIPYSNTAKYLGMNRDIRLRCKEHIKKKRRELDLKYKKNVLATWEEISVFGV
jgi:hypothetical protein